MNLRDLSYVVAVADSGHFGKAAERCFVSQPTLSGQIKKLEEELGVSIFERTNRSVDITAVGEQILVIARQILDQADMIRSVAQTYQDPYAGPLRVGAIPTLSPYLMPLILAPLKREYPQMQLILSEEQTDLLLQRLKNHQLDAALLATPVEEKDLISMGLFTEPFWVAYPQDHHFYNEEELGIKQLQNEQLLLLAKGHCLADQAMQLCDIKARDQSGDLADLRASSLETLIQLVAAGYGVTLLPALAMSGSWTTGTGVVAQPLTDAHSGRMVSLVYRSSFPRMQALMAFKSIILKNLPNTVKKIINNT